MESRRTTLLIIEDDPEIREQLRWALGSTYAVVDAEDRQGALAQAAMHTPALVTLDLGLPPASDSAEEGLTILNELLAMNPYTKVVVITGNSQRAIALRAVQLGAYDYVQKPMDLPTLKVILGRAAHVHQLAVEAAAMTNVDHVAGDQDLLGASPVMRRITTMVKRVAAADVPVLITGESGTGKGMVAKTIHQLSQRRQRAFVSINCGAIPENLLETELFGHEKGAFTGAYAQRKGRIEQAQDGVLFLDEIGDLPLNLQVKLLHFLQEQKIVRVGGREELSVDARVIAATNRDLSKAIQSGVFREDLFYRLRVVTIMMPPLRERGQDIIALADTMLKRTAGELEKRLRGFTRDATHAMQNHSWPGNVRELENRIKRAVVMSDGPAITAEDLELEGTISKFSGRKLKEARQSLEKEVIVQALRNNNGNITKTAAQLGVSRPTLHGLLSKYAIER